MEIGSVEIPDGARGLVFDCDVRQLNYK